jgi:hypothetical protein
MIKIQIVLYAVTFDKRSDQYKILSNEENNFIESTLELTSNIDYEYQLNILFSKYFDFSIQNVKKINLDPILENNILSLPVLCLIPYIDSVREGYLIPAKENAQYIPSVRKILALL